MGKFGCTKIFAICLATKIVVYGIHSKKGKILSPLPTCLDQVYVTIVLGRNLTFFNALNFT